MSEIKNRKHAIIVTGTESCGSILIAKIIAHAFKKAEYDSWDGHGFCGKLGDDLVILHRSQPFGYGKNCRFFELNDFPVHN